MVFQEIAGRRVEDKMDAKGLLSETIYIRLEGTPAKKKVALLYPGWLAFEAGAFDSNIWASSQLLQDRTGSGLLLKNKSVWRGCPTLALV